MSKYKITVEIIENNMNNLIVYDNFKKIKIIKN